jgi:AcrR family transcriptional regulator
MLPSQTPIDQPRGATSRSCLSAACVRRRLSRSVRLRLASWLTWRPPVSSARTSRCHYPSREALLQALAAQALADAGSRIADAGLERCPVPEAIERLVRALLAVGDRYAVLLGEQVEPDPAEAERVVGAPLRAVFARGIEQGILRDDLAPEILQELFGGLLVAAIKLVGERRLGLEETAAAATALFLEGARRPAEPPRPTGSRELRRRRT